MRWVAPTEQKIFIYIFYKQVTPNGVEFSLFSKIYTLHAGRRNISTGEVLHRLRSVETNGNAGEIYQLIDCADFGKKAHFLLFFELNAEISVYKPRMSQITCGGVFK